MYRRLGGKKGHYKIRELYFFSMEKEMKIINWKQEFLYTTEYYLQLREWSVLLIGCCI